MKFFAKIMIEHAFEELPLFPKTDILHMNYHYDIPYCFRINCVDVLMLYIHVSVFLFF